MPANSNTEHSARICAQVCKAVLRTSALPLLPLFQETYCGLIPLQLNAIQKMLVRSIITAASFLPLIAIAQPPPAPIPNVPAPQAPVNDTTYSCPSTCTLPDCYCASTAIPGGLSVEQTPMFVTLTADDAIQDNTFDVFNQVLNSTVNPNGCQLPLTYFVNTAWTNFWLITRARSLGYEVGSNPTCDQQHKHCH